MRQAMRVTRVVSATTAPGERARAVVEIECGDEQDVADVLDRINRVLAMEEEASSADRMVVIHDDGGPRIVSASDAASEFEQAILDDLCESRWGTLYYCEATEPSDDSDAASAAQEAYVGQGPLAVVTVAVK